MKQLLFAALLAGCAATASAQESTVKEKPAGFKSFSAAKWNPAGLAFGKIGLSGEYNFRNRKSITLGVGIPAERKHSFTLDDEKQEVSMKTFSLMAGYRIYLGKKTMTGFYFEPYAKYVKNDGATLIKNVDLSSTKNDFLLTSEYSGVGVGAQLGLQFMIAKRLVFDMFILGPEANSAKHDVSFRDVTANGGNIPWSQVDADKAEQELQDVVGDLPIIGDKIEITVDKANKTVSSSYKGFLPGFRGGISVGIRF